MTPVSDKRTVRFADELEDEGPLTTSASDSPRGPRTTGSLFSRRATPSPTPVRSHSDDFRSSSRAGSPFLDSWLDDASSPPQRSASLSRLSTARARGEYAPLTVSNLSSCSLDTETRHARRLSADTSMSVTSDESDGSMASLAVPTLSLPGQLDQCQECRISLINGQHHFIVEVNIAVTLCSNPLCLSRWSCKLCGYSRLPCEHVISPPDDLDDTLHGPGLSSS
ncbi:hypothetical protein BD626DRAFT_411221 [Schizophyllum amplum]|uniref:Uncharacterized protein n=1 Tax=Schizophyllum amplum TaxID=97359 RepID=A0A550BZK1_9AGAR|nr:hypothetical protein BD626DRAFT_411221 [Auriculariopsis ampla]